MPLYLSPDSSQLPTGAPPSSPGPPGFGIGPGTGFTTGENQANVQSIVNRGLLGEDLANQIQAIQAQKDQASLAPYLQQQINAKNAAVGAAPFESQIGATGAQGEVATNQDVVVQKKLAAATAQYQTLSNIATSLKAQPLDKNNPLDQMRANQAVQAAAQQGIELTPDELYDPKTIDKLGSATTTLLNSVKNLQSLREKGVEAQGRVAEAATRGKYELTTELARGASAEKIAAGNQQTKMAIAQVAAVSKANADNQLVMHTNAIAKVGQISPTEVSSLQYEQFNSLWNNPENELRKTIAQTQPGGTEKLRAEVEQQADQILQQKFGTMYMTAKAKAQQLGLSGETSAAPGGISQAPMPTRGAPAGPQPTTGMPTKSGQLFTNPRDGTSMIFTGVTNGKLNAVPDTPANRAKYHTQ